MLTELVRLAIIFILSVGLVALVVGLYTIAKFVKEVILVLIEKKVIFEYLSINLIKRQ